MATALAVCDQLILVGTSRGAVLVFDRRHGALQLVVGHVPGSSSGGGGGGGGAGGGGGDAAVLAAAAADGAVCSLDVSDESGYLVVGYESGKVVLFDLTKAAAEVRE